MEGDATRRDPADALAAIRLSLAESDPEALLAVDEVDRSLIRSQLERSPIERLRLGIAFANSLSRFRRAADARD